MSKPLPYPGSKDGSLVGQRPVTQADVAQLGVLYGPGGNVIADLNAQSSFGFGPYAPFLAQLPLGTPPRSTQYPVAFNTLTAIRTEDGSLSFPALRTLVKICPYYRVAIEIRKKKIRGRSIDFVPRDRDSSARQALKKTSAYQKAIAKAEAFWRYPNRIDQLRFSGFVNSFCEELFVTDGVVFYPWRSNRGELFALRQINPDTIKVNIDELGAVSGYQQYLYGRAATDYSAAAVPSDSFDRDELLYLAYNPRVDTLYGTSPVEEIATIVQLAIKRLVYQLSWYTDGNTPPAYMEAPEGISTPEQLGALQKYFDDLADDEAQRHRLRIVPKGAAMRDVRPPQLFTKDEEEAMLTLICTHLGVERAKFIAQVNRATAETGAQESEDSGEKPLEVWCKEWMDEVTQSPDYLGLEDIEVKWTGEREGDVLQTAQARAAYVAAGIVTVNETRAEMGLDPMEEKNDAAASGASENASAGDGSRRPAAGDDLSGSGVDASGGAAGIAVGTAGGADQSGERTGAAQGDDGGTSGKASAAARRNAQGKAAAEELATWRRFALKPDRVKRGRWADAFETQHLEPAFVRRIENELMVTEDAQGVRDLFDEMTTTLERRADHHPAEPIEQEFAPHAGARGAEIGKRLAKILAGVKTVDQVRYQIRSHRDELMDDGLVNVLAGAILRARAKGLEGANATERAATPTLTRYDDSQPRDEAGRWSGGGGGGSGKLEPTSERAFNGKQEELETKLSKQEAGKLGEEIVLEHLRQKGFKDAAPLNAHLNNYPVDMVQDHELIEVKTGLVSNSLGSQQWRATIGQPGKAETAALKSMSPEEKSAWNQRKSQDILDRKQKALDDWREKTGKDGKGKTITVILHPDKRLADVYEHEGFHLRIGWKTDQAKKAYVGSYKW